MGTTVQAGVGSERLIEGSYEQLVDRFYQERWTDGLPVVLPTEDLVAGMIKASGRAGDDIIGIIPPRGGVATVELVAINAVMAGCRPEHFPVVEAALRAALAPEHNLHGVTCTTHNCVSLTIVHGPQVSRLGFNAADGVFGNGSRSNGAVGRAFRLVLWNLGGSRPGEDDRSTMSQPGEWAYCIAENADASPWEPFHVERGLGPGSDAVTVFACEPPHNLMGLCPADTMLKRYASHLRARGANSSELRYGPGQILLVVGPGHARQFDREGWTKPMIREWLWDNTKVKVSERRGERDMGGIIETPEGVHFQSMADDYVHPVDWNDPDAELPLTPTPDDLLILVAGGDTYMAACCPGWGPFGGLAVTEPVVHDQVRS